LAYVLSACAAAIYVIATVALVAPGKGWGRVAWVTISVELVGVIVVGFVSVFVPALFPHDTVWSGFGRGYVFLPLIMPILGLLWLNRHRNRSIDSDAQ
jgi:hypothetical protein